MIRISLISIFVSTLLTANVAAQDLSDKETFVEANILAVFYHELGHAVIDIADVPIFGQEEDAADMMAVLLIDWIFEEEIAQIIARDSAFGFLSDMDQNGEVIYWGTHGPDEQRYYNRVCLFFGANPDEREDLARNMDLPFERAEICPEEYQKAARSWGAVFERIREPDVGVPMVFEAGSGRGSDIINRMLETEVANMNADLSLPEELTVKVDSCGEANAFYNPQDVSVIFCTEMIPHFEAIYERLHGKK